MSIGQGESLKHVRAHFCKEKGFRLERRKPLIILIKLVAGGADLN
jgi:hypothetical protein